MNNLPAQLDALDEKEIWKDIPGCQFYQASNLGRIRSLPHRNTSGKIIKLNHQKGYLRACVNYEGKRLSKNVHRLVLEAFIGRSNLQVNHKNGIKDDNRLENLEYCTSSENQLHRCHVLRKNLKGRLSDHHANMIDMFIEGYTLLDISQDYKTHKTIIFNILKNSVEAKSRGLNIDTLKAMNKTNRYKALASLNQIIGEDKK